MKFLNYILRNAGRNPVRSLLTVASMTICLFLMVILVSFISINDEVSGSLRAYNRIIVMSSQGFAGLVPIARVNEVAAMDGVIAATPFRWYGGKYGEETMPFAQFGVDPDTVFTIYDELTIPPDQLKAFQGDKAGCVVGKRLAEDRGWNVGDPLPLKGDLFPLNLNLTIRGIYDGPPNRDRRMVMFHWGYLDEGLKRDPQGVGMAGNAGIVVAKCGSGDRMAGLARRIDALYLNSDTPTRTQTEEAFGKMFSEMLGDLKLVIEIIGLVVVVALVLVAGNAMAMALRERTTEVAVLKAIGFGKPLVLMMVLAEAMTISGLGGIIGALGSKLLFDFVDASKYTGGFLPFFYISWSTALIGLAASLLIGFLSGVIP
ncbi:MAG TPA: ABC transporter permease, partial [Isosphaeraceae bacterium]|nr:ABC transporter permease [Isosphaeraceae bacterium]